MVCEKGIKPGRIVSITYNENAAEEMKTRFYNTFGKEAGEQIDFRTINSLSLKIYTHYCEVKKHGKWTLISKKDQMDLLAETYKMFHPEEYPSENILFNLKSFIGYAKNMMLDNEQITEVYSEYPNFSLIFQHYCEALKKQKKMDFDDQMVFALWILTNDEDEKSFWQNKYKYICVDEAQDVSKIQHKIIQIIACGNNIFMVGDEDQSIYGFRGAYPEALLNFRTDYINPYILLLERNYRSTPQIVEKAQNFISENRGRYEKRLLQTAVMENRLN